MSKRTAPAYEPVIHKTVSIYDLIPHESNYNFHPQEQLDDLKASLRRFGQVEDVVVKALPEGKYKIAAHEGVTTAALQLLEAKECLHLEQWNITIVPDYWSELDVKGYMAASNELTRKSSPDQEILAHLLQEQHDAGYALETLGSDDEALRQMLQVLGDGYLQGESEDGAGGDEYEVNPDEVAVRCKRGELWQLGKHRLLVDDCTNPENVKELMQGEKAVCCWTDPPYGVSYTGKTKDALTIQNDGKEDLDAFLQRAFAAIDTALEDGAAIYIAHPAGALSVTFGVRFLSRGWRLHETLVWIKDSMVLGHSDYHYRHEPILFGYKQGEGRYGRGAKGWYGDNSQTSVFEIPRPKRSEEHPTMKPLELIETMLINSSPKDGLIYEPFAGSGSTLIAAERLRRRCYAMELDEKYASVILNRWEAETGQTATVLERVKEGAHA